MKAAGQLLIGVVAGLVVVVCATAIHRHPLGLLLGITTSLALLVAIPPGWTTRTAYVAGWLLGGLLLVGGRPEGDVWFLSDLPAYALMGVAFVMALVGLATLPSRRHLSSGR